ncbi:MAG: lytic transglycosylase domain-containing protein [Actinomycetota bacterium]|nr:lytic transglycosylase domain-containing protein [Actinomycetota bacterium]
MSPATATRSIRREHAARGARRRAVGRRRRRALIVLSALALGVVALVATTPLFQEAVTELTLPLTDQGIIRAQAAEKRLDPALIAAVIYAETKFNARPSTAGAQGLMQIMPQTAEFLARRSGATTFTTSDLSTPAVNIAYGSYYLRYLLDRYHGDEVLALAAYNGGETNVDRWVSQSGGTPLQISQIPFPETRAYVLKVLQAQRDYRQTYASQLGYR